MKRIKFQILAMIFYAALLIGVVVLGVLQLGWVTEAAQRQLDSARKDMALEVTKAIEAVSIDFKLRLLNALDGQSEEQLLFSHYETIEYKQGWPPYFADDPRAEIIEQLDLALTQSSTSSLMHAVGSLQRGDRLVLLEILPSDHPMQWDHFRIYLLTLDVEQLLSPALLETLKATMPGYAFDVLNNGELLYSSLTERPEAPPEIGISLLGSMRLPPLQRLDGALSYREGRYRRSNEFNKDDPPPKSPDIFSFYERILKSISVDPKIGQFKGGVVVSVYAADGPLTDSAQRQRILNSIFSTSILILLSVTAIVLILAVRKLHALRNRERDFVATISHELRTPLTVIRSAADNLSSGIVAKPESISRYGDEIAKQSKRLERMIESTLFYSGLPQQSRVQLTEVNSNSFFTELLAPLQQLTRDQDIELITELNIERLNITIDSEAVRLIVENLILNAVIHGKPERGQAAIWLDIDVQPQNLTIAVADNGRGIPKNEQRKVFSAFTRGRLSELQQHPGSGLGLNLIARTTKLLGGHVQLQSPYLGKLETQQQGALFHVKLPLSEVDDE